MQKEPFGFTVQGRQTRTLGEQFHSTHSCHWETEDCSSSCTTTWCRGRWPNWRAGPGPDTQQQHPLWYLHRLPKYEQAFFILYFFCMEAFYIWRNYNDLIWLISWKALELTICKKSIMIFWYTLAQGFSQQFRRVVYKKCHQIFKWKCSHKLKPHSSWHLYTIESFYGNTAETHCHIRCQ